MRPRRSSGSEEVLFFGDGLSDVLGAQPARLAAFVQDLSADAVLATPEEDMLDRLVGQFEIECPVLRREDSYSPGAEDVKIDVSNDRGRAIIGRGPHHVPGTRFRLHVPFDGERDVFFLRPSTYSLSPPRAAVTRQELVMTVESPADTLDPAAMGRRLEELLADIERHLERARPEIDRYNAELRDAARAALIRRREKVLADRALEQHLAVPVTRRSDRAPVLAVDVPKKRKPIEPKAASLTAPPFQPEPAVDRADYEAIVGVISSFGSAAERFPDTFRPMGEEVLREIVLVILNNQFGPAVGELFSRKGKTDVAILQADGPVFISECKIWTGQSAFRAAVDQLLGYLVWRDTKAALILFVRNVDVSAVVDKAVPCLTSHERFKRQAAPAAGRPVFVLHHEGDAAREIEIALVVIPLPGASTETDDAQGE